MNEFLNWAASQGISDDIDAGCEKNGGHTEGQEERATSLGCKLTLAHFDDGSGRGLAAARHLFQGEEVLQAPKRVLINVDTVDPSLAEALSQHPQLSSHQVLVIHLLHEVSKGPNSFWALYLKQLPRHYSTLANFSSQEAQELQVPEAIGAAVTAAQEAHADWICASLLLRHLKLGPKFEGRKAWLWGSATVSSRTLYVPWDDAGALCPVGDLFNYAAPVAREGGAVELDGGYDERSGMYRFYARQAYAPGEQVFLCYGQYTNLELLRHYGFVLTANPNDSVRIPLPWPHLLRPPPPKKRVWGRQEAPSEVDRVGGRQMEEWEETEELGGQVGSGGGEKYCILANGEPSFCLLAALRILAEPRNVRRKVRHLAVSGERMTWDGDVAVYEWLEKKCRRILRDLPTSAQEDEVLRQGVLEGGTSEFASRSKADAEPRRDGRCGENIHLAMCWRLGYKTVLGRCIQHCMERAIFLQEEHAALQIP